MLNIPHPSVFKSLVQPNAFLGFKNTPIQPQFGNASYRDILNLDPVVKLTTEQDRLLQGFEAMAQAKDLTRLPEYLKYLESPSFKHVVHVVHKDRSIPFAVGKMTDRRRWHTPFIQLYLSLEGKNALQEKLLNSLAGVIRTPANEEARKNSIEALTDIYFYALRPAGKSFNILDKFKKLWGNANPYQRRRQILDLFAGILRDPNAPVASRRLLRNELVYGLKDIGYSRKPQVKRFVRMQIKPLVNTPMPNYTVTTRAPEAVSNALKKAILDCDISTLRLMMANDTMQQYVPEWKRINGPDNHQHFDQDYNLQDHMLHTLAAAQASPNYKVLNDEEKLKVSTAAVFHDIGKRSGPLNMRQAARITADFHHPGRSAEIVIEALPILNYTPEQIRDITILIDHHQALGNLSRADGDAPTIERFNYIADALGSVSNLKMLKVLTEGDIRSVKFDTPARTWFNPTLAGRLEGFSNQIKAVIEAKTDTPGN